VVVFVPNSHVLALAGAINTDLPGALIVGVGGGESLPPHDVTSDTSKINMGICIRFMGLLFFNYF
jgi:hypothetical protein